MNKIVVASDSFKGSLTSLQVAESVEDGIHDVYPSCDVLKVNVADGGEGTMDALMSTLGGQKIYIDVKDPLGRIVNAPYVILDDGITAVVEMSVASGLTLIGQDERNPLMTTTYGTGELIADAMARGCRKFLVGIGGSATNDAGMGMLSALGFRFLDEKGLILPGRGESLEKVVSLDVSDVVPGVYESEFIVACDVDSPFCGPEGAAYVFAPQKGADEQTVRRLDAGMMHFAAVVADVLEKDIKDLPGAGAAGGLGGGFTAFLNARLERGIEMVLDAIDFDSIIKGADLIFTGEGRVDSQTLTGKTPFGVMKRAVRQGIKVVAIGGSVMLDEGDDISSFAGIWPVTPAGMTLSDAMNPVTAAENIRRTVREIMINNFHI